MKSKVTAGILALLFGGIGAHKFYLGRPGQGIVYLLFFWTLLPAVVGLIEGLVYLLMSEEAFNAKYNARYTPLPASPHNIVVNVANSAHAVGPDRLTQLKQLHELRSAGGLSDAEFEAEKQRLLTVGG